MRISSFLSIIIFAGSSLLAACRQEGKTSTKTSSPKGIIAVFTDRDTTEVLQKIIDHYALDSLLSFAFKGKLLKIVKGPLIHSKLPLRKYGRSVAFVEVDSTSDELIIGNQPKFFMTVGKLDFKSNGEVETVVRFKGIGLLCVYKLNKDDKGHWQITYHHFYKT
ncbi:hypothetical protein [Larkinella soli]|uniref:hypothetical protein n=1 Tax=Larkinella soli TaxID=1770527 RepID=UPI000FFB2E9A|nr:hypothetical protein [Larkinella soli]